MVLREGLPDSCTQTHKALSAMGTESTASSMWCAQAATCTLQAYDAHSTTTTLHAGAHITKMENSLSQNQQHTNPSDSSKGVP
jgi:succinylarginine dihydrolase